MNTVMSDDGTTIAFERSGSGPPLILVGGALSGRAAAAPLARLLAPTFTVVAFDRRGRGDSGDTLPYAVEREVEDLRALVSEVGGRASVFGHSSGAMLALEAAALGVGVERLVLYEPPFVVDDTRPPLPAGYVARLEELLTAGDRAGAVTYFLRVGPLVPDEALQVMRGSPLWSAMEGSAHTLPYDGRIMGESVFGRPLPAERWVGVTAPTLTMYGSDSPTWQANAVRALAEVLPMAQLGVLDGQTHGFAPEIMAPVVEGFLVGRAPR